MEGRLCSIDPVQRRGTVDTRNDKFGVLTIYFQTVPAELKADCTVEFEVQPSKRGGFYSKFRSVVHRNPVQFNTEDRGQWYSFGEKLEREFVPLIRKKTGRDIRINPEKQTSPWAIDLFDFTLQRPADLKCQTTPFAYAGRYRYGGRPYDPAYTVTFNEKDYTRYQKLYPECDIYFWVDWKQLQYRDVRIQPVHGIWRAPFPKMAEQILGRRVALHSYLHRKDDDHNAKASYLFDLRDGDVFTRIF